MDISLKRINALFKKEVKNFSKNKNTLLMTFMPIFFGLLYNYLYSDINLGKTFILFLCVNMNLVLCGSYIIAMLIAEEKEKNTLRTLFISGVSAFEFLSGKVIITFILTHVSNIILFFIYNVNVNYLGIYLLFSILVSISMILIGALIGLISPTEMSTGVIGLPILGLLLIIPMFAEYSDSFKTIANFTPNYHMNLIISSYLNSGNLPSDFLKSIIIIFLWIIISTLAFFITYNKVGLDK